MVDNMRFVFVHGFNVRDGGLHTVDQLAFLAGNDGYEVDKDEGDYGYFNLWMIRLFKSQLRRRVLYRLAKAFEKADVIVTHSNGAYFTTLALNMLNKEFNNTKVVVHISPALNIDAEIPEAVKAQLTLATKHDGWVKLASYLPFMPWGRQGARGYKGSSNKVTNRFDNSVKRHSDWFKLDHLMTTWGIVRTYAEKNR